MGYRKTVSVAVALFIFIFASSFKQEAKAISFFGGASYSFAGVVAESDFYNGASDWAPGLFLGMQYGRLGVEAFIKKFTLEHDHEQDGVVYNMAIDNLVTGIGLRVALHPNVDFLLGANSQNIKASATSSSSTALAGLLDESYTSWYVGGGLKGEVYPNLIARLDMAYYKGDIEFGLFGIDFSLVYQFATF